MNSKVLYYKTSKPQASQLLYDHELGESIELVVIHFGLILLLHNMVFVFCKYFYIKRLILSAESFVLKHIMFIPSIFENSMVVYSVCLHRLDLTSGG